QRHLDRGSATGRVARVVDDGAAGRPVVLVGDGRAGAARVVLGRVIDADVALGGADQLDGDRGALALGARERGRDRLELHGVVVQQDQGGDGRLRAGQVGAVRAVDDQPDLLVQLIDRVGAGRDV